MLILASTVTGCVSFTTFAPLADIQVGIANSATTIKICVITAVIKKYKLIIQKKEKKHDKIISKPLIGSNISHDEFVSTDNV